MTLSSLGVTCVEFQVPAQLNCKNPTLLPRVQIIFCSNANRLIHAKN